MKNQACIYIQEWPCTARALCVTVFFAVITAGCAVQTDPEKGAQSVTAVEPAPEPTEESNGADTPTSQYEIKTSAIDVQGRQPKSQDRMVVTSRTAAVPLANRVARKVESEAACCDHFTRWATEPLDRENYEHFDENPVKLATQ